MDGIHCALTARITSELETKFLPNGSEVLVFSALADDTKADPDKPEWLRVSCFAEKVDEHARRKLKKGALLYLEGRIRLGRWTGQDGSPRAGLNINAWSVVPMAAIGHKPQDERSQERQEMPRPTPQAPTRLHALDPLESA